MKEVAPALGKSAFTCPHCNAFAHQTWEYLQAVPGKTIFPTTSVAEGLRQLQEELRNQQTPRPSPPLLQLSNMSSSCCQHCKERAIWRDDVIVYPFTGRGPPPHPDMPQAVKAVYLEARQVLPSSPRAAGALLRLALELLTTEMRAEGANLSERLKRLEGRGLPHHVVEAMDVLRLAGNRAVHPREIDIYETPDVVLKMFHFLNLITDFVITKPREIQDLRGRFGNQMKKG